MARYLALVLLSRCFFLAVVLACAHQGVAQQVEVTRHDVDQGLPQSMVNHVLQDRDGFIWLGTGDGLARFDGHRFVVYKHDPRDSTSLSHNSIWGLALKDAQHMYVGTRKGLDVLDLRTGRFTLVRSAGLGEGCWQSIRVSEDKALFYSPLLHALLRIEKGEAIRSVLAHRDAYISRMSPDGNHLHQLLDHDTLLTLDLVNGTETVALLPVHHGERVFDMIEADHRWLFLTSHGAWTWDSGNERGPLPPRTASLLASNAERKHVERAPDGTLWLGISGVGVVTLHPDLSIRDRYPLLPVDQRPLQITSIAFDRQGNTWVGSDGKGVFTIAPQRTPFGRCMPGQGLPWEPASWFVRGFAQWDPTHVLVSFFQGGLALFDEGTKQLTPLNVQELGPSTRTGDLTMPMNDANGRVWFKEGAVVRAIDPSTGRIVFQRRDTCGNVLDHVSDGGVCLGSSCTPFLRVTDAPGTPVLALLGATALEAKLDSLNNTPAHFHVDGRGRIWTSSELLPFSVWSPQGRVPFRQGSTALPDGKLRFVGLAEDGPVIWTTTDQGLLKWRAEDLMLLRHFTVHDGLPDQYLYGMLPAGDGTWWISSNNGLSRFDPAKETFTSFSTDDGLQSKEFNGRAHFRSAGGRLYFGGVNGFNHFRPQQVIGDADSASVHLIGLTVQDSAIDPRSLGEAPEIVLPYGRNAVRIDLAVLEFTAPERNTYRYRIQGYSEWSDQPAGRPIALANMPAGTYVLEVSGVNGHGLVSAPRTLLTIHVPLPFWASRLAFLLAGSLLAAGLGGIAFALYRRRVKVRLERAEQQMKELRIRTRLAHDLHDDVGSGLAQIGALARMAERRSGKGEASLEQMTKVKDISQELMDNLRDVVWVNDPVDGDLATLLIRMKEHVRDLFEPVGATCGFDLPVPLPERRVGNRFKRNLFLLFKEATHNALKYSATERIELLFRIDATTFTCALIDHGSGRKEVPAQGGGHGLANMHDRAAEIGARLLITDTTGGGTTVSVTGPLTCLDH